MKIRPMFGVRRNYKRFDYQPRYYTPPKNTGHREIQFQRLTRRGQVRSVFTYAALLFLVLYLVYYLVDRFNV